MLPGLSLFQTPLRVFVRWLLTPRPNVPCKVMERVSNNFSFCGNASRPSSMHFAGIPDLNEKLSATQKLRRWGKQQPHVLDWV
jgi:hypothetical protein